MAKPNQSDKIKLRIAKAKAKKPEWFDYVQYHPKFPGMVEAIFCKICRTLIRGLVEDERFQDVVSRGGKIIVYKKLIMASFASYTEIEIEFDDGSKHVTSCCRQCANRLQSDDLEELYSADLAQWEQEGAKLGGNIGERKPVKIVGRK